jgi:SAM-dependent methyltransferase
VSGPELVARTLQISTEAWRSTLDAFANEVSPAPPDETVDEEIRRCLPALALAYTRHSPPASAPPLASAPCGCPACGELGVHPLLVRPPELVYGRCNHCGHGVLLGDGAPHASEARARQAGRRYYVTREPDGVGYDRYDQDADYREAKGARLIAKIGALVSPPVRRLLEVGSGYGFVRIAAERAGLETGGVDVNDDACLEAERRYGLRTFRGTLAEALARSPSAAVEPGAWDVVLYQFVLEHVADPVRELEEARRALRPHGWLVLLVPNMDAAEVDVFGASYRSFRADHLHLFTVASLAAILDRAGFRAHRVESHCNIHIFRDVLSPRALERLYESGRGPDLFVLAQSLS